MTDPVIKKDGTIRFEHRGYIISVSGTAPSWHEAKVAYWKDGDERPEGMKCPKHRHAESIPKLIAKAVNAIDRIKAKENDDG